MQKSSNIPVQPTTGLAASRAGGGKPRVAYLTNRLLDWETREPRFGGGERYCLTLASLLKDLGYDVTFYQTANRAFEGEYFGFRVIAIPAGEQVSEFQVGVSNAFNELSKDYDHVIYNTPNYASGLVREDALLICHGIWFDHNLHMYPLSFRTPEWFEHLHRAFSGPRKIVSVDANSINVIRALWPELAERMIYLPNWVDTNLFYPPARRDGPLLTVLFPRRSDIIRGSRLLGPILERVPHDCRVLWVGEAEAEDNEQIEAIARRDPRLQFHSASFDEMPDLYRRADICVIPTVASEGTSLSCLEGLASGCALVATAVGGLPELVQPRVNGILVDPDPEAIAGAVNRLIEHPEERARFQQAARATAQGFCLEAWREQWIKLLERLGWLGGQAASDFETVREEPAKMEIPRENVLDNSPASRTPEDARGPASRDDASELMLRRNALHLSSSLTRQEQVVHDLSARLKEREQALEQLSERVKAGEKIIEARDEAVRWLKDQINEKEVAAAALSTRAATAREMIGQLSSQLERERADKESLAALLREEQSQVGSLLSQITEQQKIADRRLDDQRDKIELLARREEEREANEKKFLAEAAEKASELAALRGRLAEAERSLQTQAAESKSALAARDQKLAWLSAHAAEKERAVHFLSTSLSDLHAHLDRMNNSIGWRMLSRYGRIKYRYLLPLYRLLGLMPEESRPSPQLQTAAPAPQDLPVSELLETISLPESIEEVDFYAPLTLLPHLREEEIEPILTNRPRENAARRPDVVCFSIIDWEFRYQRPQQIMSQFAANGHRVFYISPSRFQPRESASRVSVKEIKKNVFEVSLMLEQPFDLYGAALEGGNLKAGLASLGELRALFDINEAISYVMIASWAEAALATGEMWGWRVIYDCMDEWENFPGIKRTILDHELELVRECDLLVVTAQRLYEKWEPYNRPMVLARNGVDYDFYSGNCRPNALLSALKGPIIGYYGAIADWFDLELMARVAGARPDYTFVLLGGVFDVDVSGLKKLPNVHLLGQQPYETMPQYLYHFDACMIPFKINPITEATDPVKVYEYLSGGKPVVSVALPELEPYKDYLYIASGPDDFAAKLDAAVAEDDAERVAERKALARLHTWENRYRAIQSELSRITPRASIIIVTYNNLALTRLCIESVIKNTEHPNYEIVVVDNDSSDQTRAYLRYIASRYSHVSIILNRRNEGFARANNQGIARSTGERIILLNNDTIVPPGWLSRLLRHLEDERIGLVGPVTNFVGNEAKIDVPYRTWSEMEAFAREYTRAHEGRIADIHMLAMFCVAFRREIFEEIGPLDEQFGIGMFEDDDYSLRIKKAGYRVVCTAGTFVHHFGQAAFKKLIKTGDYNPLFDRNREYYEKKWNTKWVPHKHVPLKFEPHSIRKKRKRAESARI